ncbi:hypothetical protein P9597_09415 [Aneurinibacillus migulanus]|uniref:hypothetical protein n=1 Tax=Aneurinibacillus migulanus TaxID=47500 RepID=UPI002E226FCA|nr:hypothetical protein [Aneurinibacillus migulanus]
MQYTKGIVFFIDILGTQRITNFDKLYNINSIFHDEFELSNARNLDHVKYERKAISFSDCTYIFYFFKDYVSEEDKDYTKLLEVALHNTSLSILRFLDSGFLVRGGVTIGDYYFESTKLFGPAVNRAYFLEAKEAKYPRILIDDKIAGSLLSAINLRKQNYPLTFEFQKGSIVLQDEDGKYYLNYLNPLENSSVIYLENHTIPSSLIEKSFVETTDKINILRNELVNSNEDYVSRQRKILEKLEWHCNYLNSVQTDEGGASMIRR